MATRDPETNIDKSPLKMDGLEYYFLSYWGPGLFSGAIAVSFREGIFYVLFGSLGKGKVVRYGVSFALNMFHSLK